MTGGARSCKYSRTVPLSFRKRQISAVESEPPRARSSARLSPSIFSITKQSAPSSSK
jgi:hypothetical protein